MKKNINFLIGTLADGGAERVVSNLSLNINKYGKRIINYGYNSKIEYPYEGELVFLDKIKTNNLFMKIYAFIYRLNKLKRMKNKVKDETFISFLEYQNLLNILSRTKESNTIVSVRNHVSSEHKRGIKSKVWKKTIEIFYNKADLIIAVSKEIKKDLIENYKLDEKKIKVIYNFYDLEKIKKLSIEALNESEKELFIGNTIINVGRLTNQKGQLNLIRIFRELKKEIIDAKLVILGRGELEKVLIKECEDIKESVIFLGYKENPFKYIYNSNIFVMTSYFEGFPNSLAEAMATGTVVLSTDCKSGPREILAPKEFNKEKIDYVINKTRYGILAPLIKENSLNEKKITKEELITKDLIVNILKNEELQDYFKNKSIERVKCFSINEIINNWIIAIESLEK